MHRVKSFILWIVLPSFVIVLWEVVKGDPFFLLPVEERQTDKAAKILVSFISPTTIRPQKPQKSRPRIKEVFLLSLALKKILATCRNHFPVFPSKEEGIWLKSRTTFGGRCEGHSALSSLYYYFLDSYLRKRGGGETSKNIRQCSPLQFLVSLSRLPAKVGFANNNDSFWCQKLEKFSFSKAARLSPGQKNMSRSNMLEGYAKIVSRGKTLRSRSFQKLGEVSRTRLLRKSFVLSSPPFSAPVVSLQCLPPPPPS